MTTRHYEATGETKRWLKDALNQRAVVKDKMHKWAKSHGGNKNIGIRESGWGFFWALSCDQGKAPNDPEHWKLMKNSTQFWVPRLSTKIGKQLDAEMKALSEEIISADKIRTYIKVPMLDGLHILSVGVHEANGRIIVSVPTEKYTPPKGIHLKRISDVTYERLMSVEKGKVKV